MRDSAAAFHLRYGWSAWPSGDPFCDPPPEPFLRDLSVAWERDGLRLLEHRWQPDLIQMTFSATPDVAPVTLARVAKGRLQHALGKAGWGAEFSRKVCVRSIGHNTRETVEAYIRDQLVHADLADPRYRERLQRHAVNDPKVRLNDPYDTNRGQYWYNLHIVLVASDRSRVGEESWLQGIVDGCREVASQNGYGLAKVSVMPDHVHLAVRGDPEHEPAQIAEAFRCGTAKKLRMLGFWKETCYVGTFGEYTMAAVRS